MNNIKSQLYRDNSKQKPTHFESNVIYIYIQKLLLELQ